MPEALRGGRWRRTLVDPTHSNVWHDRSRAELETVETGTLTGDRFARDLVLLPNSITMIEFERPAR
jgi:hypothetical protein